MLLIITMKMNDVAKPILKHFPMKTEYTIEDMEKNARIYAEYLR
jgi:hypothetical protein